MLQEYNQIIKIKYFTALVKSSESDPSKPERQRAYLRALLSIPNLEIIEGILKKREIKGKFLGPLGKGIGKGEIVKIRKYEEKESDVNIASHVLVDSVQKDIDCIVLLSNDTDLKTPLFFARKIFHKKIGIISPSKRTHYQLQEISHFNKCITEPMLGECQFPTEVGKVKKPYSW